MKIKEVNRMVLPKILFAEGKKPKEIVGIVRTLLKKEEKLIITRVSPKHIRLIKQNLGKDIIVKINNIGKIVTLKKWNFNREKIHGRIALITAGIADKSVAEEVAVIAEEIGCEVIRIYDVGINDLSQTFHALSGISLIEPDVIVCVAGWEASLPNIVAAYFKDLPVIGVPTDPTALAGILNACNPNLAAVGINDGVGAGIISSLIARHIGRYKDIVEKLLHKIIGQSTKLG